MEPAGASNPAVIWSSSNKAVADVDADGMVTAVGEGSAVITANAADGSGIKADVSVTVKVGGTGTGTGTEVPKITKGMTKTYKNVVYTVNDAVAGTVIATKAANKKLKKAVVQDTVDINGVSCKVVEIQKNAFKGCKRLQSVTIGANVKIIGKNAFAPIMGRIRKRKFGQK